MSKETLEEAARNDKKIEDYYIGKTLKLKKTIPSRYYETTLQESETIKIDKFVDGDVEGCRVAIGYKDGFEFLLFNTTHAESYLQGLYSLIDEPTITQEEPKSLSNLEERFKREMSMVVMPLDNENIPEEDYYDEDSKDFEIASLVDFIDDEDDEPKQGTLEKAAEHNYPSGDVWTEEQAVIRRLAFKNGAKWQAKRMYTEEEVKAMIEKALTHNDYNFCGSLVTAQGEIRTANFGVWFEEFKKK